MDLKDFNLTRKSSILKNGLRVVVFERPKSPVFIQVIIQAGSRFNPKGKDGLAHFAEHMIVSGNTDFKTKEELALYTAENAIYTNAFTNRLYLWLESKAHESSDYQKIFNLIRLSLTESIFDIDTIEKERGAILQEIRQAHTNRDKRFSENLSSLLYQKTDLEPWNLGTEASVEALSRTDIVEYIKNNIFAENIIINVSGGITYEMVADFFSKIELPRGQRYSFLPLVLKKDRKINIDVDTQTKDVKIGIVFSTVPWSQRRERLCLQLIAAILGVGPSSYLFSKLRYDKGFVYSVTASIDNLPDVGRLTIATSVAKEHLHETQLLIAEQINRIKMGDISDTYIGIRKNIYKKLLYSQLENVSSVADIHFDYTVYEFDSGRTIVDDVGELQTLTKEELVSTANKYLTDDNWYLSLLGPVNAEDAVFKL